MIKLFVYDAQTFYEGDKDALKKYLHPALRLKDKNAYYKERAILKKYAYVNRIEDDYEREWKRQMVEGMVKSAKYVKFYDGRSRSFLTGLLPRVLRRLEKHKVRYRVHDRRKPTAHFKTDLSQLPFNDTVDTRPEQLEVVKAALRKKRGILNCATNFGKTEVAAAIAGEFNRQKMIPNVLFLVHRIQLVKQTADRFEKHLSIPVTCIGGGVKQIPRRGILVATIQTANNLLEDLEDFMARCDILFIDEFHVNKAWVCTKVTKRCLAPMRFGLSGTIDEKNKRKMMHYVGMTGPVIASVRNEELVNLGRSARPIARFVEFSAARVSKRFNYRKAYRRGIVDSEDRNRAVVKEILRHLGKDRNVLVTVSRISHGHILQRMLEEETDLRIEYVHGSTTVFIRDKILKKFQSGRVSVLIASPIFDVGVDIPEGVDAWVNAAAGVGWELVLQRLGRVLRRKKRGKNVVYISDFVDRHNRYLFRHSLARMDHYRKERVVKITIVEESHA